MQEYILVVYFISIEDYIWNITVVYLKNDVFTVMCSGILLKLTNVI